MMETPRNQNHLAWESSPYLLQHAANPVDWYPWGEKAFQKAKRENKPIFLSIGYSTCHWCHVMAHESFEDEETAKLINEYFVPVKVDREERPDIDHIYMQFVTATTGHGGWPLTVFLTPDKKAFYGGTYYPPEPRWGTPGLKDVLTIIHQNWMKDPEQIIESSNSILQILKNRAEQTGPQALPLNMEVFSKAWQGYSAMYDVRYGGFGQSPKFPMGHNFSYLLRYWRKEQSKNVLDMVEFSLKKMGEGGVYDQLGGGFHRYATDQQWQIPHFEKMLYDQAILARVYIETYQITGDTFYEKIARGICDYVLRDLMSTEGGFYSAEDADSIDPVEYQSSGKRLQDHLKKKEGAFYVWSEEELRNNLNEKQFALAAQAYSIKSEGNAHSDPHGEFVGKNILFIDDEVPQETAQLDEIKHILFNLRQQRPRPHLDDKVLTDWNGLMISSLAYTGRVLNDSKYLSAAQKAADFIIQHLITEEGRLLHRYRDGEAGINGMLEDYAFFTNALLDLYEAILDEKYLILAVRLTTDMVNRFWDQERGGFYLTADDSEELVFRPKEAYDGAIPSGNSVAALVMVRLHHMTSDQQWQNRYEKLFKAFAGEITSRPGSYAQMLSAYDFATGAVNEVVFAAGKEQDNLEEMVSLLYKYYIPNKVVCFRPSEHDRVEQIVPMFPFIKEQEPLDEQITIYFCENHACQKPVTQLSDFKKLLETYSKEKKTK
ncbi:MAG: thioredoxin domain-containing protein [Candidatus Omnitrophica bacterium]|nr:thioredoxin domain-containing protein [Candidatus Omnitrophota bacterium]